MFSKQPSKSGQARPPALLEAPADNGQRRPQPAAASLIAENMTLEGSITGEGELHVDGVVRGDIRIGKLTIGDTGHIEGSIYAETVDIRGRVIGAITAKQVRLYGAAHVDGDLTHDQLSVEAGAFFQGRSLKFQKAAPLKTETAEDAPLVVPAAAIDTPEAKPAL